MNTNPVESKRWLEETARDIDSAIDLFLNEFMKRPYFHRIELSLYHQLFSQLLHVRPALGYEYPIGNEFVQLIHLEYPTSKKNGRYRGNFDFAILNPYDLENCDVSEFRSGVIEPPIAIEMGLDKNENHFKRDRDRLLTNEVKSGYVIHLVRNKPTFDIGIKLESPPAIKIAYACACEKSKSVKRLGDDTIKSWPRS